MPTPEQNEEALFAAALERPPGERAAFLDGACRGSPALRERLDALLAMHEKTEAIPPPPADSRRTIKIELTDEVLGRLIGRYKLLEKIGEGGCGVVYVAEQTEPVRRRVALKLVKPGMDTKQVLARFEAERQALALMDHPNIAKVFDAGTTDTGRPFFVMELVRGKKITEHCDSNKLSTDDRLKLFMLVCQAVQHAHQKGIIHRDLKPSNVLVTLHDGVPVPKVIDFGIAKAISNQPLTNKTVYTAFEQFIGTPAYMSPEQAEMSGLDIDTRSDIYSLGVLLYELLTGCTPFDAKTLMQAGLDEMRRIIREQEPSRPSTRLSTLSAVDLTTIAHARHAEPPRLLHTIRGDLDWIAMKCLEKDRARRYETANGLATDIRRHLDNEPVVACPPSGAYRFQKLVRRNKAAFVTVGFVAASLVIGTVVSTWQAIRATRAERLAGTRLEETEAARQAETSQRQIAEAQRAEAEKMRKQAEANFHRARAAVDDMYTQVAEKWLAYQPKLEPVQREFLQKALQFYAEFAQQTISEPSVRFETGMAYRRVGDIQHKLGAPGEAETAYGQAIDRLQKLADEFPAVPGYRQSLADTLHQLGLLFENTGSNSESEKVHRRALALEEKLAAEFPAVPEYRRALGRGQWFTGEILGKKGRDNANAVKAFQAAIAIQKNLVAEFPAVARYRQDLAASYHSLGSKLKYGGNDRIQERREAFHEAVVLLEKLVAEYPTVPEYREELANTYFWRKDVLPTLEQEQTILAALALQEKLAADFPAVTGYRYDVSRSHQYLGDLAKRAGRIEDAEQSYRQAMAIGEKLAADSPGVQHFRDRLKVTYDRLGDLLRGAGRLREAEAIYRQAIATDLKLVADFPEFREWYDLDTHRSDALASILVATGRPQEAIDFYRSEIKRQEELLAPAPKPEEYVVRGLSYKNRELANLLQQLNRLPEAETARRRAVQYFEKLVAEYPSNDGYRHGLLDQRRELDILSQRTGQPKN